MARAFKACSVDGCNGNASVKGAARGWCWKHYQRWKKHGDPLIKRKPPKWPKVCRVDGCQRASSAVGYCAAHYERFRKYGNAEVGGPVVNNNGEAAQWLSRHSGINQEDCLEWPFGITGSGYGAIYVNGSTIGAYRQMCILAHGEPPTPEYEAAHSCGNAKCVNPNHLRWATKKENQADRLVHGTDCRGEKCATAKLTEADVREIRRLEGSITKKKLSDMFGVHPSTIYLIHERKSWSWLD